ncbi:MAG TPA: hypothetical protein VI818_02570 [Candidatus Thermoplasmatota archaeon]|nr:hypothetical protein [Candidatus Thermoplasmatota archaeon]
MKTVTRVLLFLAAVLVWLVVMVFLNLLYLNVDDNIVVGASLILALASTYVAAKILRT